MIAPLLSIPRIRQELELGGTPVACGIYVSGWVAHYEETYSRNENLWRLRTDASCAEPKTCPRKELPRLAWGGAQSLRHQSAHTHTHTPLTRLTTVVMVSAPRAAR